MDFQLSPRPIIGDGLLRLLEILKDKELVLISIIFDGADDSFHRFGELEHDLRERFLGFVRIRARLHVETKDSRPHLRVRRALMVPNRHRRTGKKLEGFLLNISRLAHDCGQHSLLHRLPGPVIGLRSISTGNTLESFTKMTAGIIRYFEILQGDSAHVRSVDRWLNLKSTTIRNPPHVHGQFDL